MPRNVYNLHIVTKPARDPRGSDSSPLIRVYYIISTLFILNMAYYGHYATMSPISL